MQRLIRLPSYFRSKRESGKFKWAFTFLGYITVIDPVLKVSWAYSHSYPTIYKYLYLPRLYSRGYHARKRVLAIPMYKSELFSNYIQPYINLYLLHKSVCDAVSEVLDSGQGHWLSTTISTSTSSVMQLILVWFPV